MAAHSRTLAAALALITASLTTESGCHGPAKRTISRSTISSSGEPALTTEAEPGATVIDGTVTSPASPSASVSASSPSARTVSAVDRHPLLRMPKQYYDSTDKGKAAKVARAAVVGVPAGIVGEFKQIFSGTPSGEVPTVITPRD